MGQLLPGTFYKANVLDLQGFNSPPDVPEVLTCRLYYNSVTNTFHVIDSSGVDILAGGSGGVTSVIDDTNVTGTIISDTLILGWQSTLAAGRLNPNVVQNVTNDTNIQGTISSQILTFSWNGQLGLSRGGTNADLSASGGTTHFLAQDASHVISSRALIAADVPNIAESQVTGLVSDLALKENAANKGVPNGYASLDSGGIVPLAQLPSIVGGTTYAGSWNASTNTPTLASGVGTQGFFYVVSVAGSTTLDGISSWGVGDYAIFNGTVWQKIPSFQAVTSVAGRTGAIVLGESDITNLTTDLGLKAPLLSPAFTGNPTAPTQSPGNNSTRIATTAYADAAVLVETNARIAADALKANLASPVFTGTPTAPTASVDTNTTQLATTAFVLAQASSSLPIIDGTAAVGVSTRYARADHVHPTDISRAALVSPTFTGTPSAPTAAFGTNTTQLATTAFVQTAVIAPAGTVVLNPVADQTISGPYVLEISSGQLRVQSNGLGNFLGRPSAADILSTNLTSWGLTVRNSAATEGLVAYVASNGDAFLANADASGSVLNNIIFRCGANGSNIRVGPNSGAGIGIGPLVGGVSAVSIDGNITVNLYTGAGMSFASVGGGLITLLPVSTASGFVQTMPAASGTIALTSDIFPLSVAYSSSTSIAVSTRLAEATGGSLGITLTTLSTSMQLGQTLIIKKVDSGVGSITIVDTNSANFDGDSSYILLDQWQYVSLQWNGTRFNIIGNN